MATITVIPSRQGEGTIAERYDLGAAFHVAFVRVHFTRTTGTGADIATFKTSVWDINPDSRVVIDEAPGVGVGSDYYLRNWDYKLASFPIGVEQELLLGWTTPDGTDLSWGIELGVEYR